jgi:hypothetical protein
LRILQPVKPLNSTDETEFEQAKQKMPQDPVSSQSVVPLSESVRVQKAQSHTKTAPLSPISTHKPMELCICGSVVEIYETLEQFAWLSATLRFPSDHLSSSRISLNATLSTKAEPTTDHDIALEMALEPLFPEPSERQGTCWIPLFDRSVLAWGFEVAERGNALGLEMSFVLMLQACGTAYPIEFKDAAIISRDWITIYPCGEVQGIKNGLEWHAVSGNLENFFMETRTLPVYPLAKKVTSVAETLSGRMFVGWVRQAKVMLATSASGDQGSGLTNDESRGLYFGETFQFNAAIRPPMANLGVTGQIHCPRLQQDRFEERNINLIQAVTRSTTETMLYYDVGAKTGWLVPEFSFVMHLAFARLLRGGTKRTVLERIRYAAVSADGGNAALDAFTLSSGIIIGKHIHGRELKDFTFGQMIKDLLDFLDGRKRIMDLRLKSRALKSNKGLRGWDFEDLRDTPNSFCSRVLKAPNFGRPDWWDLANQPNLLVVFANNVGQVIVPDNLACSSWQRVPAGSSLLACTVRTVCDKAEPWKSQRPKIMLSANLAWHQPSDSNPFEDCHDGHGPGHRCNPVQLVRKCGILHGGVHGLNNPNNPNDMIDGAAIFGERVNAEKALGIPLNPCRPVVVATLRAGQLQEKTLMAQSYWIVCKEVVGTHPWSLCFSLGMLAVPLGWIILTLFTDLLI